MKKRLLRRGMMCRNRQAPIINEILMITKQLLYQTSKSLVRSELVLDD